MDVIVGTSANVVVEATSSSPVTVETSAPEQTVEVVSSVGKGAKGDKGDTGGIVPITVSVTPPVDPDVNDLWIDIS